MNTNRIFLFIGCIWTFVVILMIHSLNRVEPTTSVTIRNQDHPHHIKVDNDKTVVTAQQPVKHIIEYHDSVRPDLKIDVYKAPSSPKPILQCPYYDLVYTWVNGSDPKFLEELEEIQKTNKVGRSDGRYRDLNGLKYSLRSLKKHAPWLRKIFIVTNGQIPNWYNLDNPFAEFIFHNEFFYNKSHLPTYNSVSIESNFFNLPDKVGDCFLYFNDDIFCANDIFPEDLLDEEKGQAMYFSRWTAPIPDERKNHKWHLSLNFSNSLLDKVWGEGTRNYSYHGPLLMNKKVLKLIYQTFKEEMNIVIDRRVRHQEMVSIPFLYSHFVFRFFTTHLPTSEFNVYASIKGSPENMTRTFDRLLHDRPKTVCLNDALPNNYDPQVLVVLNNFFETLFPDKPDWEIT